MEDINNYNYQINSRLEHFKRQLDEIERNEGSIENFANSYQRYGLHLQPNNDIVYREYAPSAKGISLCGEFNGWNRDQYWAKRDEFGCWTLTIPNNNGQPAIHHNTKIKCNVVLPDNSRADRNPIWSRYLIQDKGTFLFDAVFWNPPSQYNWNFSGHMSRPHSLRIYEAHVGMSSNEEKVSTYREFADNIIPRIKRNNYTAIQLMAIAEHADYASFGYHVTNFFAVSSRCGTPEDLKYLIDKAHQNGLFILMDIVHSHASSNVADGINYWDGTDYLYFHGGSRGYHSQWNSRLFNYSSYETLRFLLSNCAFWLNEFHFDGFRFDGVTSILYKNHGINYGFSGAYHEYFCDNSDEDGAVYTMLANYLIHKIHPDAITVAEDVSGMPFLCLPIHERGFAFDYRLNMSICDKWIHLLKNLKDEQWEMGSIVFSCTFRRPGEKHIGYCESHDQSIVGDKTISMWLMDKEIYWNMSCSGKRSIIIDRGIALHKMIRMVTFALGGEAYLNFMGNEFGHPEWVDFPRPGNDFSYYRCRRRWDLCDNHFLRYKFLYNWDLAMMCLDDVFNVLNDGRLVIISQDEKDKLLIFQKGDLLFVFNFHPCNSYENYRVGTGWSTPHKIVLDTDEGRFFGTNRLDYGHKTPFPSVNQPWMNESHYIQMYLPSRTCIILCAEENIGRYDVGRLGNISIID